MKKSLLEEMKNFLVPVVPTPRMNNKLKRKISGYFMYILLYNYVNVLFHLPIHVCDFRLHLTPNVQLAIFHIQYICIKHCK